MFFPRGLDEIRFEECLEPCESVADRQFMA